MADNTQINTGTGDVIAAEDISGVKYQRMKLIDATVGSTTPVGTTANPLKVAEIESDCTVVLSTTITTTGPTSGIDTTGYGALVWQLSGAWQGNCTFEASNDNSVWDTILVFSRDNLSLQDIITSGGLYTIRPSGKYVRLNVANITGSMTVVAIGREAEGIAAADLLSLAMDRQNNTPLYTSIVGASGAPAVVDPDAYLGVAGKVQTYRGNLSLTATTNTVTFPCEGHMTAMVMLNVTGAGSAVIELFNGYAWANAQSTWLSNITGLPAAGGAAVSSGNIAYTVPLFGASAIRVRCNGASSSTACSYAISLSPFPLPTHMQASVLSATLGAGSAAIGDVGIQYRANATGAATVSKFTAAATTNAASIKASAGRVIGWHLYNTTASAKYFRFFNKASAPTMGTDSPAFVVVIPANSQAFSQYAGGIGFATGIAIACTGAVADLDTTVTAANDVLGAIFYA